MAQNIKFPLLVPAEPQILNLFPNAPKQGANIVLSHDIPTTKILRNLGLAVPAPVASQYQYSGTRLPFEVQKKTVEMLTMEQRAYVLSGMGVGKTACPLWAFDFLRQQPGPGGYRLANRMLVIAPLSTLQFTWFAEMIAIKSPYKSAILYGTKEKRLKLLGSEADIYIINHDGVEVIEDALVDRTDIDVFTIDELSAYRNNTGRTKVLRKLAAPRRFVWGMTGAPTPQAPTDVYNEASIITPGRIPKHFGHFRTQVMYKIPNTFKWVPKHDATERAFGVLQPSVRYTLDDVRELPPYISRLHNVAMGSKQTKVYDTIKTSAMAMVNGEIVSAANKGVVLSKLLQISLGYVYTETKGVVTLDNKPRLDAIGDIISSCERQIIVLVPFKHALAGIETYITSQGYSCAVVHGDVKPKDRNIIFDEFQNHAKYKVLLAHPVCISHGLTLTAADTVLHTSPIMSLDVYDQVNARIRRTGQKFKQQFIHLQATVAERKMYAALMAKQNLQDALLAMFEDGSL